MFGKSKSGPTEELTFLETKFAYSADRVRIEGDVVRFAIRALPSYEPLVKIDFAQAPQAVRLTPEDQSIIRYKESLQ